MPKKTTENSKREEILSAALTLFLQNGYEKTSIRMISQSIGCEVGLIYYYFKTKDDVFENALGLYLNQTEKEIEALSADEEAATAEKILLHFAEYLEQKAISFREEFSSDTHISIRATVKEKISSIAEKHLTNMLQKAEKKDAATVALFLSKGLCAAAFCDDGNYYEAHKAELIQTAKTLIGADTKESSGKKREIPSFLL